MEVVLHYRPFQNDLTKLQKLVEEILKEFPVQQLPRFVPWFPNDSHKLPLKPKRQPPIISGEKAEEVKQLVAASEPFIGQHYDCTVDLLEFQSNLKTGQSLIQAQTVHAQIHSSNLEVQPANEKPKLRRSWSISVPSPKLKEKILPLSRELQSNLERLKLHAFYRAKWTIEQSICNNQTLEDIWIKLNTMIKHNELPTCNATIQRCVDQIWVFCDILYSEYVGNLLRERLNLTGRMNLLVHKYGIIFSL
ncbi:shieldin complex subunit 3 [Dermochelys coriacea]|uniref:shieldin complex subunit 3 n=1 Tax=Dermochelys coriacea TaxID=27794 RepID=UPI0018E74A94|nr:shieldin complex subunit 3 [Dermochelys coriacea]XP_043370140.1 shieldin complex subunit 3 [Dermochelys coriacea]XP_043370141.1 shieldin complex subunit 3 [Dermochelys coriacea]